MNVIDNDGIETNVRVNNERDTENTVQDGLFDQSDCRCLFLPTTYIGRTGGNGCCAHDWDQTSREESLECPVVRSVGFARVRECRGVVHCSLEDS